MEFLKLLHFLLYLSLAVASHASLDVYWKAKLPNTPIPKAVRDLLRNGGSNSVTQLRESPASIQKAYIYATADQLHSSQNFSYFFLMKDLRRGASINMQFLKSANTATFLPRKVADSIPFSSKYIAEILRKYSLKPESTEAEIIKNTIKECEEPVAKGEDKYCPTSLESMIDFSITTLGNNVQALSNEAEQEDTTDHKYTILDFLKLNNKDKAIYCHIQNYVYAVFYCHATQNTDAYMVFLASNTDGAKAKAVAVCHKDTSAWNPKHLAFQVLKVKPGTVPICHFFPDDHVVWVPK